MADEEKDPTLNNPDEEAPESEPTPEASSEADEQASQSPEQSSAGEDVAEESSNPAPEEIKTSARSDGAIKNMDRILDIKLELVVKIGTLNMKFKDVLDLFPGSVLEIDKNADGPLELVIGNKKLAEGEVVTVGENLGLRIIKR
jgi:flagellar motor switch protein FliN